MRTKAGVDTRDMKNRSFTVDLSRARSRRWKSEFLSTKQYFLDL